MEDRKPAIVPLDFWVEYKPQPDGTVKEEERVKWVRRGSMGAETSEAVHRLKRDGGPIWEVLWPSYEAWKNNRAAPIQGTPIAHWPGGSAQLAKALEPFHIKAVEELADLTDSQMDRVMFPNIRKLRNDARSFVEAMKTTAVVARDLAAKDEKISGLETELAELKELVASLAAKDGVTVVDDAPRKPGRPRKAA